MAVAASLRLALVSRDSSLDGRCVPAAASQGSSSRGPARQAADGHISGAMAEGGTKSVASTANSLAGADCRCQTADSEAQKILELLDALEVVELTKEAIPVPVLGITGVRGISSVGGHAPYVLFSIKCEEKGGSIITNRGRGYSC